MRRQRAFEAAAGVGDPQPRREDELFAFVARRVARGEPLPYAQLVAEGTAWAVNRIPPTGG